MEYVYAELGFESNTYGESYFFMTTQLFCISLMVIGCLTYWAWRQYREKQSIRLFYLVEERSRFLDSKFMELRACNPQMDGFQLMCKAVDELLIPRPCMDSWKRGRQSSVWRGAR